MHRTEGANNSSNEFTEGPPGTTITADWLNSVQEELAAVIEYSGLTLYSASNDTQTQLRDAIFYRSPKWQTTGSGSIYSQYVNSTTGTTATDGTLVGIDGVFLGTTSEIFFSSFKDIFVGNGFASFFFIIIFTC